MKPGIEIDKSRYFAKQTSLGTSTGMSPYLSRVVCFRLGMAHFRQ